MRIKNEIPHGSVHGFTFPLIFQKSNPKKSKFPFFRKKKLANCNIIQRGALNIMGLSAKTEHSFFFNITMNAGQQHEVLKLHFCHSLVPQDLVSLEENQQECLQGEHHFYLYQTDKRNLNIQHANSANSLGHQKISISITGLPQSTHTIFCTGTKINRAFQLFWVNYQVHLKVEKDVQAGN